MSDEDQLDELGTLANLFILLDGWSLDDLSSPHHCAPDGPLELARIACATGQRLDEALLAIDEQIKIARPMLRAVERPDVLEDSSVMTPGRMREMLGDLHLAAGALHNALGDASGALDHFVDAAVYMPSDPRPPARALGVYLEQGRYDDAIAACGRVAELAPSGTFAFLSLAASLERRGAIDEAARATQRALDRSARILHDVCARRLADAESTGDPLRTAAEASDAIDDDAPIELLVRACARTPDEAVCWYRLGQAIARRASSRDGTEDLEQAIIAFEIALDLEPRLNAAALQCADLNIELERPDRALAFAEIAVRMDPEDSNAWAFLAISHRMLGHLDVAMSAADEAIRLDATNELAQFDRSITKVTDDDR